MIRAIILAATIATLICLWREQPPPPAPSRMVQVDYCPIDTKVAGKDELGNWRFGWSKMYGPCHLLDRYEYT